MSIIDIIKPIELLRGSHGNASTTGRGCIMNVVSYLSGDREITDRPTCACPVITPIAIWLNDSLGDGERKRLMPYVSRISGSRTDDIKIIRERAWLVAEFAKYAANAATHAANAANAAYAAANAAHAAYAAYAANAAAHAAGHAANAARHAANAARHAAHAVLHEKAFTLLDAMLSLTEPVAETPALIERATKYVELSQ